MKNELTYKNCLIHSESFELGQRGSWVPRFRLTQQNSNGPSNRALASHDRLDKVCRTEAEADAFAIKEAIRWVDNK
ncbi:MAG: hypothetical protein EXR70_10905 [Deltaproteobacteria bacterium]|nr:hypothetical protein [Deltaproteobacteria bacterium]